MLIHNLNPNRKVKHEELQYDLVIVGGGLTGVCAAISAARKSMKVALIQDRPVLGGTGSSEIRVWMLGATSHMGNNNRWAREGGIVDEILVENTFRNKEGNPILFDMVLIDKVKTEKNISLYLNTMVYDLTMNDRTIESVSAYNSAAETRYTFTAPLFCDATGDGFLGFLSGATYRRGAEDKEEFNERFAQDKEEYGDMLGSSILFYFKETPQPVKYIAPEYAMKKEDVEREIVRIHNPDYFDPMNQMGCKYWWIEYGGRMDTIHDNEDIKFTLWKVAFGIWDYIKNSGKFPEAANKTLEWVGLIPGKRESRRFVGSYILNQNDIIEQRTHYDTVTFGGWSVDLHPADGVFSKKDACNQWHSKGIYEIPYRCYVTQDVENLFFGGRLISATHVAFGSTRVMLTSGVGGEVIGAAASLAMKYKCKPIDITDKDKIKELQNLLLETGNHIPLVKYTNRNELLEKASIEVSSELILSEISFDNGFWRPLEDSAAQMLPFTEDTRPTIKVKVDSSVDTTLEVQLRVSSKPFNHTPDVLLEKVELKLEKGIQEVSIAFKGSIPETTYGFICFMQNSHINLWYSPQRLTGVLSVFNKIMPDVSNWGKQTPPPNIGIEEFEFWCPERRPGGHNIAMKIEPALSCFGKENLFTMLNRPINTANAWVASCEDLDPKIKLKWENEEKIHKLILFMDTDFDHPMETVQWGHCDNKMPFCVDEVTIIDKQGKVLKHIENNYKTLLEIQFKEAIQTDELTIAVKNSTCNAITSVFALQVM